MALSLDDARRALAAALIDRTAAYRRAPSRAVDGARCTTRQSIRITNLNIIRPRQQTPRQVKAQGKPFRLARNSPLPCRPSRSGSTKRQSMQPVRSRDALSRRKLGPESFASIDVLVRSGNRFRRNGSGLFSCHCFTRSFKWDPRTRDSIPDDEIYDDGRETRVLCADRYHASRRLLRDVIVGLATRRIVVADERQPNFVTVETASSDGVQRMYAVFFEVSRDRARKRRLILRVQSAHMLDGGLNRRQRSQEGGVAHVAARKPGGPQNPGVKPTAAFRQPSYADSLSVFRRSTTPGADRSGGAMFSHPLSHSLALNYKEFHLSVKASRRPHALRAHHRPAHFRQSEKARSEAGFFCLRSFRTGRASRLRSPSARRLAARFAQHREEGRNALEGSPAPWCAWSASSSWKWPACSARSCFACATAPSSLAIAWSSSSCVITRARPAACRRDPAHTRRNPSARRDPVPPCS